MKEVRFQEGKNVNKNVSLYTKYRGKSVHFEDNVWLCKLAQQGDEEALNAVCQLNLPLVHKYAELYTKKCPENKDDAIQEGLIGIMYAAKRYDETQGAFPTYAIWYIRCYIIKFLNENTYNIRIPTYAETLIHRITDAEDKYLYLPYPERIEQIAKELELSPAKVKEFLMIRYQLRHSISLDLPVMEPDKLSLLEAVPDTKEDAYDEMISKMAQKEVVQKMLGCLKERERYAIELRYGFTDGEEKTLEQVGNALGVGAERARQILARAERKLTSFLWRNRMYHKEIIGN